MSDKGRELACKIARYWYGTLHGQIAPIFQKQKLADFAEAEIDALLLEIEARHYHLYTEYLEVPNSTYRNKKGDERKSLLLRTPTFTKYVAPVQDFLE